MATNIDELKRNVRELFRKTIETRFSGANYADLAQVRGYADGYMRALLDAQLVERGDLLKIVAEERRRYAQGEAPSSIRHSA